MVTIELECHTCGLYESRNILATVDAEREIKQMMSQLNWLETEDGEICSGCAEHVYRQASIDRANERAEINIWRNL